MRGVTIKHIVKWNSWEMMVGWWVQGSYKAIYWRISESMNGNPVLNQPILESAKNLELFCNNFWNMTWTWSKNTNFPQETPPFVVPGPGPKTPRLSAQLSPRLPLGPLQWRRRRGLGSHLTGHEETGGGTEVEVRRLGEELPGWHFYDIFSGDSWHFYDFFNDIYRILLGF